MLKHITKINLTYTDRSCSGWIPEEAIKKIKIKSFRPKIMNGEDGSPGIFIYSDYINIDIHKSYIQTIKDIIFITVEDECGKQWEIYPVWPYVYWDGRNNGSNIYQQVIEPDENGETISIWIVASM